MINLNGKDIGVIILVGTDVEEDLDAFSRTVADAGDTGLLDIWDAKTMPFPESWGSTEDNEFLTNKYVAIKNFQEIEFYKQLSVLNRVRMSVTEQDGTLIVFSTRVTEALGRAMDWYTNNGLYAEVIA